jgi:hypothetical protein
MLARIAGVTRNPTVIPGRLERAEPGTQTHYGSGKSDQRCAFFWNVGVYGFRALAPLDPE